MQVGFVRAVVATKDKEAVSVHDGRVGVSGRGRPSRVRHHFAPGHGGEVKGKEAGVAGGTVKAAVDVKGIGVGHGSVSIAGTRGWARVGGGEDLWIWFCFCLSCVYVCVVSRINNETM